MRVVWWYCSKELSKQRMPNSVDSGKLSHLLEDIQSIKEALLGDAYREQGLIERFHHMESRLDRLEKILDRSRFTLLGLTLFACSGLYEWGKRLLHLIPSS